jgi:hypothetical protein
MQYSTHAFEVRFRRVSNTGARILKHFESTVGRKVGVQGFQLCLLIF